MKNYAKQKSILLIFLVIQAFTSCSQPHFDKRKANQELYACKFNSSHKDYLLLLGCMMYEASVTNKSLRYDKTEVFLGVASRLSSAIDPNKNVDSLIEVFINKNKQIDFNSFKATSYILAFIENCNLVYNVIFGDIESDAEEEKMKILQGKIMRIPELAKIYRIYNGNNSMASFSSTGGAAFDINVAYYLSIQTVKKRNQVLKALL